MDVICDIDGTIADLSHRRQYVATKPKNWPAFFAGIPHDKVIAPIRHIVRNLFDAGHNVFFCSGRNEASREATCVWLRDVADLWHPSDHPLQNRTALFMRKDGDYRADDIVKEEILDHMLSLGIRPDIIFDDRQRVVDMWRRRGYVCAQVAEGNF